MNLQGDAAELLERYLWHVERRLPKRKAADVILELDSLMRDQLEAQAEALGRPIDRAMVVELLKSMGSPRETAARYHPQASYLIGPGLYPAFLKTLGAVSLALALAAFIPVVMALIAGSGGDLGWVLLRGLGTFVSSFWSSLGMLVLIFAVMDRRSSGDGIGKPDEWDPLALPEQPRRPADRVSMVEAWLEILGPIFLLVLLNASGRFSPLMRIPALTRITLADLGIHLPMAWVNGCLIAQVALGVAVLRTGCWNIGLRWAKILLGAFNVGILVWIAFHVGHPAAESLVHVMPLPVAHLVLQMMHIGLRLAPLLALVLLLKEVWMLVRSGFGRS